MTQLQKELISIWMHHWAHDNAETDRTNQLLKDTGLFAYEQGNGLPCVHSWYNGPIAPGMKFRWCHSQITTVTRIEAGRIYSSFGEAEVFNEESNFRENAMPVRPRR